MFVQIIALGPKIALIRGSIVLHRLIKVNVKNLLVSDSGPLWPSCVKLSIKLAKVPMILQMDDEGSDQTV